MTSRAWCGTLQCGGEITEALNVARSYVAILEGHGCPWSELRYFVGQLEKAPETGTFHLQFYAETKRPVRATAWRLTCGDDSYLPHVETRKASERNKHKARDYCMKEDSRAFADAVPWEIGEWREAAQGARADLEQLGVDVLANGAAAAGLANPGSYIRYNKGMWALEALQRSHDAKPMRDVKVAVLWGDTGVGKSWLAHHCFASDDSWVGNPPSNGSWYAHHYAGETRIILDEFRGSWFPLGFLLRLLDVWRLTVNTMGSSMGWQAEWIIITSNIPPEQWYPKADPRSNASLMRRLNYVHFLERRTPDLDVFASGIPRPLGSRPTAPTPFTRGTGFRSIAATAHSTRPRGDPIDWDGSIVPYLALDSV